VWLGLLVTGVAIFWTLRGVDFAEVGESLSHARVLPLLLILPIHPLGLYLRAVRWRYLVATLDSRPVAMGALFRATAIGFMAINVLPFRVGELVRPWVLSRETGVRGPAALGTLILERAIDFATLLLIGAGVLYFQAATLPEWVRIGAVIMVGLSLVPLGLAIAMRLNKERTLWLVRAPLRPLPPRFGEPLTDLATQVCLGLAGLQGRGAIGMVMFYSGLIWAVLLAASFGLGLLAFDVGLSTDQAVLASYTTLVFTALAVAAPSAPGFFGVYHFACREALTLFGVSSAVAVAYGTVLHMAYWIPVTLLGGILAARSGIRFSDLSGSSRE
jgi:hypothetical protein